MTGALDPDAFFELLQRDAAGPGGRGAEQPLPAERWRSWWAEAARLDPAAAGVGFVLNGAEFAARGTTRSQLRTAVRRERWYRAGRGLVSPVDVGRDAPGHGGLPVIDRRCHALAASAASRLRPDAAIAGRSAAVLHGLPTFRIPTEPELLTADVGAGHRSPAHLFTAALRPSEITGWYGRPVTLAARTLADLGRHDRFDAIMAADAALRERLTTPAAIDDAVRTATGWPGVRQARAVLALADPLAESPLESVTRLRIHDAGLPAPQLQAWIAGFRVDFYWPDRRLVLEADGRVKYTAEERWAEKTREQAIRRCAGHRVERVVWADVLQGWPEDAAAAPSPAHLTRLLTRCGRFRGVERDHTG